MIFNQAHSQTPQQFKSEIDDIIGDDSEVIRYVDYAFTPKFIKLATQKDKIMPACLDLIYDMRATHSEKIIAMMLMNNISNEKYILFLDIIFQFYKMGRLNQYELEAGLFPEHPLNDIITNNYKLPSERALLSRIILCHCVSKDLSHLLFDVLTGYYYRQMQEFYRECCTTYKFRIW